MREILFRGMTVNGKFVEGNLSILKNDLHYSAKIDKGCYISNSCGAPFAYQVRPDTVGQFTGITDKNGNKIFEGDICSYLTPEYKDNGVHYEPKRENGKVEITNGGVFFGGWQYATPFGGCVSSIAVIGNIHDNPELLS